MIEHTLTGREHDLGGGFLVRRLLPSHPRQSVGPFVFFDHFGPVTVGPASNVDVRPHPHIGLATVSYLFEGAIMHRDSLGSQQRIEPGAINWMTAGNGIVHSERRPDDLAGATYVDHGLQLWVALPLAQQAGEPAFAHTPAAAIPHAQRNGVDVRVLVGSTIVDGSTLTSPVKPLSDTLFLDLVLAAGGRFELQPNELVVGGDDAHVTGTFERAVYVIDGDIEVDGQTVPARVMAIIDNEGPVTIESPGGGRAVVVGGASLAQRRLIWWNFVASERDAIIAAADTWQAGAMPGVAGDDEFIPLPARTF